MAEQIGVMFVEAVIEFLKLFLMLLALLAYYSYQGLKYIYRQLIDRSINKPKVKRCLYCNLEIPGEAKFCGFCGRKF